MIFRKEDQESGSAQQLSGADTGTPGNLAAFRFGCFIELTKMLLHDYFHFVGRVDFFKRGRSGFFGTQFLAPVFKGY
jgi:hypothetical protein